MSTESTFKQWFVAERAEALAMILLTRRDDLQIAMAKDDPPLSFFANVVTEKTPRKLFGIVLQAALSPATSTHAAKVLKPALELLKKNGPFQFPVVLFYFAVKEDKGFYAWGYEPIQTEAGTPKLKYHATPACKVLDNEALHEIVTGVSKWFDVLYEDLTV